MSSTSHKDGSSGQEAPPTIPDHVLLQRIGAGSYGEVWLARNVMRTFRAVKIVHRRSFDSDRPYEREFAGIQKFEPISRRHESQLDILHVGRNDTLGYFYYVMELADDAAADPNRDSEYRKVPEGSHSSGLGFPSDLSSPISGCYQARTLRCEILQQGRLPVAECVRVGLALATALEHLHSHGLVHRDIKPSNIVFVEGQPKLADIGLVTDVDATMSCVGTDGYLPPEGPGAPQADIFALGKVLYEISTGHDRKEFPDAPENFADLSDAQKEDWRELNAVVLRACQPRPADRYATATALREALELLKLGKSVRRQQGIELQLARLKTWGTWSLALLILVAGVVVAWQWQRAVADRARAKVASAEARVATETASAAHRELLLRDVQMARQGPRISGWFDACREKLREVARLKPDDDARTQAAACLDGFDAKLGAALTNAGSSSLAFSADGQTLLCAGVTDLSGSNAARLWRVGPSNVLGEATLLPVLGDAVAAWKTNGTPVLFQPGGSNNFLLREATTGRVMRDFPFAEQRWQGDEDHPVLALSTDGRLAAASVALTNDAGRLAVWDTERGVMLADLAKLASALAFSPDGRALAVGDHEGGVRVYSVPDFVVLAELPSARVRINCFAFTRDPIVPRTGLLTNAWWLAVGDGGGTIHIWRTATREQLNVCRGSLQDVFSITFHPDGVTLASAGRTEVRFWDSVRGSELLRITSESEPRVFADYVRSLVFAPDGHRLACANEKQYNRESFIGFWEMAPSRGVQMLRGLDSLVFRAWFSPDGRWLAALANNWQLAVWELPSGRLHAIFETPQGDTADNAGLAFHTNGASLAFCAGTEAVSWNLANRNILRSWQVPWGYGDQLAFDQHGQLWLLRRESPRARQRPMPWTLRLLDASATGQVRHRQLDPAEWHPDGFALITEQSCFVAAGCGSNAVGRFWRAACFDLASGAPRWPPHDSKTMNVGHIALDSGGKVLSEDAGDYYGLRDLVDGGKLGSTPAVAFAWERKLSVQRDKVGCPIVFGLTDSAPSVLLGADDHLISSILPVFRADGRRLAWGTESGVVMVADVDQVRRQLKELNLDVNAP
jgi:WD40 repeat protein